MGITIGGISSLADSSGASAAATINTALQSQVDAAQTSSVEALFGSLGLGTHTNTTA